MSRGKPGRGESRSRAEPAPPSSAGSGYRDGEGDQRRFLRKKSRLNPIVDVGVLRARYVATLGAAIVAGFTIVETFAFGGGTRQAIAFALGIGIAAAGVAGLALSLTRRGEKQQVTALP